MNGRAASGVKNRFYCIYKSSLSAQTVQKIKETFLVKKMYKSSIYSSELYRKINSFIREECLFESFLDLDKSVPYTDLVYKLRMTASEIENHARLQGLLEKAQQLYKDCQVAKKDLAFLQQNHVKTVHSSV